MFRFQIQSLMFRFKGLKVWDFQGLQFLGYRIFRVFGDFDIIIVSFQGFKLINFEDYRITKFSADL
jgi:hypothetical protein